MRIPPDLEGLLKTEAEANLLKYTAGSCIECPSCHEIMDWRRTVVASVFGLPEGKSQEVCAQSYTQCVQCFDRKRGVLEAGLAIAQKKRPGAKLHLEVIDGREARFDVIDA